MIHIEDNILDMETKVAEIEETMTRIKKATIALSSRKASINTKALLLWSSSVLVSK
jgi:hypothetical protein